MITCQCADWFITLHKQGSQKHTKVSYPIRYGYFHEIQTPEYIFQYNLNGELFLIQGKTNAWPHPSEWLKRTVNHDWVYYFSGGYTGIFDYLGEYYLPCFSYPSNSLWDRDPFKDREVQKALQIWPEIPELLFKRVNGQTSLPDEVRNFSEQLLAMSASTLQRRSCSLHEIVNNTIPVLPPDARHMDYDCIPVMISDGCLYNCGFCSVKGQKGFTKRSKKDILLQLQRLREFYGNNIHNYNTVFLGQNDALNAGRELILFAAENAYEIFGLGHSYLESQNLLLFGSVDSLLHASEGLFSQLNSLPFQTYINIGLESAHQETLDRIQKPISKQQVKEAFDYMLEVNAVYENIEITANFLIDALFPEEHWQSILALVRGRLSHYIDKGTLYFSPLRTKNKKYLGDKFREIKTLSRLPMYFYLIQRL
jgi:hypothetical protein